MYHFGRKLLKELIGLNMRFYFVDVRFSLALSLQVEKLHLKPTSLIITDIDVGQVEKLSDQGKSYIDTGNGQKFKV